jgi:hypothetical protein
MTDYNPVAPKRPTLLTVLCILSFIAGAWGLIDGARTAFTNKPQEDYAEAKVKMEEAMDQLGDDASGMVKNMMDSAMEMTEKAVEHAKPIGYAGIVLSALSLLGVWMMWNLKRTGFWLYLLAAVGALVVPIYFLGGSMTAILSVGFMGLITLIFIVLYATNLKHMS